MVHVSMSSTSRHCHGAASVALLAPYCARPHPVHAPALTAAAELNAPYTVQEKAAAAWKAVRRGVAEGPQAVQTKAQQLAAAGQEGVQHVAAGLQAQGRHVVERAQGVGRAAGTRLAAAAASVKGWLPPRGSGGSS